MIQRATLRHRLYGLALIVMIAVGALWSLGLVALIVGIFTSFILLKYSFKRTENTSTLFLVICSLVFYSLSLIILSLGLWLIAHTASLTSLLTITTLVLLVSLAILRPKKQDTPHKATHFVSSTDIIALVFTFALLLLILLPVGIRAISQGFGGNAILGLVDGNVDDGAHLAIINDRIQYDQPILTKTPASTLIRTSAIDNGSYPVGWHAANAAIAKALIPNIKVGAETLYYYIASKFFWFAILSYAFFYSGIAFTKILAKKLRLAVPTPFVVSLLCLFAVYFLIDQFRLGFYSFIPQLLSILLLAHSISNYETAVSNKSKDANIVALTLLPLLVFGFGGGLSWTLLLPATCIPIILVVLHSIRTGTVTRKLLLNATWRLTPIIVSSTAALGALIYLMRVASQTGLHNGFIDSINTYGLISVYNQSFLAFIVFGTVGFFILKSTQGSNKHSLLGVALLTVAILVQTTLIYIIQLSTAEVSTYYYFKSLNALYILSIPLAVAGVSLIASKHLKGLAAYIAVFAFTLIYIGFPAGNSPTVSYLKGEQSLDKRTTALVMNTLLAPVTGSTLHGHTIYFNPSQPRQTDIANILMRSIPLYDDCFARIRPSFTDGTSEGDIVRIMKRECSTVKLDIHSPEVNTGRFTESATLVTLPSEIRFYSLSN